MQNIRGKILVECKMLDSKVLVVSDIVRLIATGMIWIPNMFKIRNNIKNNIDINLKNAKYKK
jgi:prolyl-tRNA synthetase